MKMHDILNVIKNLARSQGFYGRLYNAIAELRENDADGYAELTERLEAQNFNDALDIVFYFEC